MNAQAPSGKDEPARDVGQVAASEALEEHHDRVMALAKDRWRKKVASVPLAVGVMLGLGWLLGDVPLPVLALSLGFLVPGILHLLKGPSAQLRPEIVDTVIDVVAKRRPLDDLTRVDLPSAERLAHLRSVCDVLEEPDTFLGRHARILGPAVAGLGGLLWAAGGIASMISEEWSTAGICFAMALGFPLFSAVGMRRERHRYVVLDIVEKELERLEAHLLTGTAKGGGV